MHFVRERGIHDHVILGRMDHIGRDSGRLIQLNRNQQNRSPEKFGRRLTLPPVNEPKRHVGDVDAGFFKQGLRLAADIFERRKGRGRAVTPDEDFVFPRGLALLLIELHKSGLAVRGFLYRRWGGVSEKRSSPESSSAGSSSSCP